MVANAVDAAEVMLWGRRIGAVCWDAQAGVASFEFDPAFQQSGIQLAPLQMPLGPRVYRFPSLTDTSFLGLPGLLADSLLGDFGNAVMGQWRLREGLKRRDLSPVGRLRYLGRRGMGALEFRPALRNTTRGCVAVDVASLVRLARQVLDLHDGIKIRLRADAGGYARQLDEILRVGTSAGGVTAKAVVARHPDTGELRSGQLRAPAGFQYWILKLDGVRRSATGLEDQGRVEFAYARMAALAGIRMPDCRLLEEGGRSHFMARRFDRSEDGDKKHVQSLYAIAHADDRPGCVYSYEQAFAVMRRLDVPDNDVVELFRRMVFNVVARNQDDSTKHIAFLMDKAGRWSLAPAFDVVFAYNPGNKSGCCHRMSINGRCDSISRNDLITVASAIGLANGGDAVDEVVAVVRRWPDFAATAGVTATSANRIGATHRLLE